MSGCCGDDETKQGTQAKGLMGLLTGPRRWWLFAAVGVAAGLTLGWEQLVFFGIAPILVSLLPCLVMCGLGLCMMKCKEKQSQTAAPEHKVEVPPVQAQTSEAPETAVAINKSA